MSLGSRDSNQGLRTEQAKRMIVRHVRDLNLQPGDRIPSYQKLRSELGLGDATITRAVKSLKSDGVLITRRRAGMYVVDSEAGGHYGRVVGLAALRAGDRGVGPFYSYLLQALQAEFQSHGCRSELFYQNPTVEDTVGLELLPGLERSISTGLLDAVVLTANIDHQSWQHLEEEGMYPCFVGAYTHSPRAVFLDVGGAMRSMVCELIMRGCRRPALIGGDGVVRELIWPAFCDMLKDVGGADPEWLYFTGSGVEGARQIAARILACDVADRPDGIAILDDMAALAFTSYLVRERSDYAPQFAVMAHRQIALEYPFKDIMMFECDIDELARNTAEITLQYLVGGKRRTEQRWVSPRRIDRDALSVPAGIPETERAALMSV